MKNFFKEIKHDLPASAVVFFVAVPLCLGIALASGAPLFSGIIAGIVGGIIVGAVSGSQIGVSGPAAGLAVIVLTSTGKLGSYEAFLLAVVLAGLLQIIMGIAKLGNVAYYFPTSVIKGMLTAIGLLIILKQIPHALGYDSDFEGDEEFIQADHQNTFTEIITAFQNYTPAVVLITIVSLIILILSDTIIVKKHKVFQLIPGPVFAILVGILIHLSYKNGWMNYFLSENHLVKVPVTADITEFLGHFITPDFSQLNNPQIYFVALIIAVIASLETLLSVEAADKLDPYKRITPTNRELMAQGTGNIVSGLIGGLPVTQVIVRSSANIAFGGRTKLATISHGLLLLLCAIFIPKILNLIPLATLACILFMVGYKLAKPAVFKEMYAHGWEHFAPFTATVVGILFTDLLIGIGIGMTVAIYFILRNNVRNPYSISKSELKRADKNFNINLAENITFFNKGGILQVLKKIPNDSSVIINGTRTKHIHKDVIEIIKDFKTNASIKNIKVEIIGMILNNELTNEIKTMKTLNRETQALLAPMQAIQILKDGNKRFINNLKAHRNHLEQVNETSDGQFPLAVILSCIDSRTSAELIFDQGLGDVFSVRIAGNILNEDILGSMEFACKIAGAKVIAVMGHTECGAIKGACDGVRMGNLSVLLDKIKPAIENEKTTVGNRTSSNRDFVEHIATRNVQNTMKQIIERSPILLEMIKEGKIAVIGGMYDVDTGVVEFYDEDMITENKFR